MITSVKTTSGASALELRHALAAVARRTHGKSRMRQRPHKDVADLIVVFDNQHFFHLRTCELLRFLDRAKFNVIEPRGFAAVKFGARQGYSCG